MESKRDNNPRNAFEDYKPLADKLLHTAHFWKTDDTWSSTLGEINKVCEDRSKLLEALKGLLKLCQDHDIYNSWTDVAKQAINEAEGE